MGFLSAPWRYDRSLLIRLAAQNVGSRRARALFLGAAVMLGVGIGFASFVAGWALREGIGTSFARMGADLLVVPTGTLVNITATLLTVQPTDLSLAAGLEGRIAGISGIARVAPQRIVPALVDGHPANLIAFDPARDFSVLNWLEQRSPGPIGGIIAGGRQDAGLNATLSVCGMPLPVSGRLAITGVGPFDESFFLSFDTLADVVSFCRASTAAGTPPVKSEIAAPVAADHAELCSPNLPPDRVSAFLLQLSPQAKPEAVKFNLAQLPNIKIVEGNTVLTSSRQALRTLLLAIAVFTALQLVALLILVSLLFSAIIRERHREVGLLRAMGARPGQVMMIILTEAVIITGLAGVAGLALGAAVLLMFARSLGLYFGLLGVPFSWPPLAVLQVSAMIAVAFSVGLGLVGALLPAWRLRRITPYGLIHSQAD